MRILKTNEIPKEPLKPAIYRVRCNEAVYRV